MWSIITEANTVSLKLISNNHMSIVFMIVAWTWHFKHICERVFNFRFMIKAQTKVAYSFLVMMMMIIFFFIAEW